MTNLLREMWLQELWPTCREMRRQEPQEPQEDFKSYKAPRATCPACGNEYAASNLRRHINRWHLPSDVLVEHWQKREQEAS